MRFGLRESIFIFLLLAMPVAAFFFVFQPRNQQIEEAYKEISKKRTKLQQLETQTKNIEDLGMEIDRLTEAIEVFQQKLPERREVEVILKQVWELADKHQLLPKSVRTDKPISSARYDELPIKMKIVGDFDGFYSFLLDLEKLHRITRLPQMKLVQLRDSTGQVEADITLSIFFESRGNSLPSRRL